MMSNAIVFGKLLKFPKHFICLILFLCFSKSLLAHPMPNSIVFIDFNTEGVHLTLKLPLNELELAYGFDINKNPQTLIANHGVGLKNYLLNHIKATNEDNQAWKVEIGDMEVETIEKSLSGAYNELVTQVKLTPPTNQIPIFFSLHYSIIINQVVTHEALVFLRKDWGAGINSENPRQIGVISTDIVSNTILPFNVTRAEGSWWQGFKGMVNMGVHHIAEGTDHLMFLLTLLLPAPLLLSQRSSKKWGTYGGLRYCLNRLLKITIAFTIGHSITLILGTIGWVRFPSQPIEVLIALSIFISAIHALRPIFPQKEIYIALGFGFIHGLAFAGTLSDLNLSSGQMAISILGFNIGIELMQLFIVVITVPWLIILSQQEKIYTPVRLVFALLAVIISLAWIIERLINKPNPVTQFLSDNLNYAPYLLVALGIFSIGQLLVNKFR
jgi:HupE / UreJ protein